MEGWSREDSTVWLLPSLHPLPSSSPCLRAPVVNNASGPQMAVELEAKMSVESFDPVRAKLREAGATRVGDHFEVNTFFDTPSRTLTQAKHGLRLRVQRDGATGAWRSVITWK